RDSWPAQWSVQAIPGKGNRLSAGGQKLRQPDERHRVAELRLAHPETLANLLHGQLAEPAPALVANPRVDEVGHGLEHVVDLVLVDGGTGGGDDVVCAAATAEAHPRGEQRPVAALGE